MNGGGSSLVVVGHLELFSVVAAETAPGQAVRRSTSALAIAWWPASEGWSPSSIRNLGVGGLLLALVGYRALAVG